ncbi:MAG: hypothetical protein ACPKM0_02365 [Pleomorphochaeta sp.]
MKKSIIFLFILLITTSSLFAVEVGSKFDYGFTYCPSITLDDSDDLPVYSSVSSMYDIEPLYFKIKKEEVGAYLSILHVSRSIVYSNTYLREFSAIGLGLDWGHNFNETIKINTKLALGVGTLGESTSKEMYINMAFVPSYKINDNEDIDINLNLIVNVIYRKYLLSPTVGLGATINLDWDTDNNSNTNNGFNY